MPSQLNRAFTNVCSDDLTGSKDFYVALFDFAIEFESDWFIQLKVPDTHLELGIIKADHEIVPGPAQGKPTGMYLTFVVDDVAQTHSIAQAGGYSVTQKPEATFYGQNRMVLIAPEGTVCDVSSPL